MSIATDIGIKYPVDPQNRLKPQIYYKACFLAAEYLRQIL